MSGSGQPRVFISYARKDGASLAQRLQKDLSEKGFDAWLDTQRIEGGASWTTKIESALDDAEYVLALMTKGSYVSEICRAEQLRALRKGKCVIPLMAVSGSDVPLHLEARNYRDFTNNSGYSAAFNLLLDDLHAHNGVELKPEFRETYVTVPPLPVNFVERPEAVAAVRNTLMADDGGRHIALTALQGMGGIGKTVLAQALCCDEVVQQAFPDGVIWVTVGKDSQFDPLTRMREVGRALKDDLSKYYNLLAAKDQYRTIIRKKAALIVVDDVWRSSDLEPFLAENSARSRLLFTTRDASIAASVGAQEHIAELLSEQKSREVLARWAGADADKLPPIASDLIHDCGRLPLALSMVGAMVRGKPPALWKRVLELLQGADLAKIKAQFPGYPYTDVLRAMQVSVDALDETARGRYLALAVLLEDMSAAPEVQQCIWGVDEGEAVETAEQFVSLSLAQRGDSEGSIKLHDLQLDYVRAQYPDKEALKLIHGAMRLSSTVIANDPGQFASQMVGRLVSYQEMPAIADFTKRAAGGAQGLWLRALQPALHPPGTALVRTLSGHTGVVAALAVTPDGQRAVSASWDATLKVWDLASGRELRTLSGHTGSVYAVALTPDGQQAVSASSDATLKVWELESGRLLRTLEGHSNWVNGVAVTADGKRAVSASNDNTLKVWDLSSGRELRTLSGHEYGVTAVAVTPDECRAVSASNDATLKVWDLASGRELGTLSGHSGSVNGVAVTADGKRVVSASDDKTLKVWDLDSGRELRTLIAHSGSVRAVAVTPDGQRAVSASRDQTLEVWDLERGREPAAAGTLSGHTDSVNALTMTPDGERAVSASEDKTLKVWDLTSGRELRTLSGHSGSVGAVAVTPDGQRAVSASDDQTLKVWDLASGRSLRTLSGHSSYLRSVHAIAVTPDGQRAVSASADKTLKLWDLASGRKLRTLSGHKDSVYAVAATPDGQRAVSASVDKTLKVWDLASGRALRTLSGHSGSVWAVAVTPDGQRAVSACRDRTLKMWELATGRELRTLSGHSASVWRVAVTPDGQRAVSASSDQTLKVWDLSSGRELRTLSGHTGDVLAVAVSPDGQRAVSASRDNAVKVWDLQTGECLTTFTCDSTAHCCAWSDALKLIVAGDSGGHVHFLKLEEPKKR